MSAQQEDPVKLDALLPDAMAHKVEDIGVAKAKMGFTKTFVLAFLAGAFIGLGAIFATTVTTGSDMYWGMTKLLGGLAFSLGLILVIVAGAELFTGNNLISMAWASKRIKTIEVLRNWVIVYFGNLAGALSLVVLMLIAKQYTFLSGEVGVNALNIAAAKCELGFLQAIALGVLCNVLVCLAVWLCFSARTTTDKILAIIFPITAFVAAGFEHSVANMYFIPKGLLIKTFAASDFWNAIGKTAADYSQLTWSNFLLNNLLPVTIGNIIGGAVMVGMVYWFVFLRKKSNS
ncbi:MAG: formate transporter FocA [Bacteroidia bacterium]|nr:formate transporter FocA [Bacteroidia bacterium]